MDEISIALIPLLVFKLIHSNPINKILQNRFFFLYSLQYSFLIDFLRGHKCKHIYYLYHLINHYVNSESYILIFLSGKVKMGLIGELRKFKD